MNEQVIQKLKILTESAKYDVSCASSGTVRRNSRKDGLGNTVGGWGICHSFSEDGRCISLLKIMLTNYCIYDCAYCINRVSNDIPRATLSVSELVDLTIEFYRRNYIEGLFLSSGVVRNPDYTMERLVRVAKDLREVHRFNGYIHLKSIPGASEELVRQAGRYADRLSVNLEIPTERISSCWPRERPPERLQADAVHPAGRPRKCRGTEETPPCTPLCPRRTKHPDDRGRHFRNRPRHPQRVVGPLPAPHHEACLLLRIHLRQHLRQAAACPETAAPGAREPPLSADWLLRFYQFRVDELVDDASPDLDLEVDPKLAWALRHPEFFPVNILTADYEALLRVPGIGVRSARLIVLSRRFSRIGLYDLKRMGAVVKKARYFITCHELPDKTILDLGPAGVRKLLLPRPARKTDDRQLSFDFQD